MGGVEEDAVLVRTGNGTPSLTDWRRPELNEDMKRKREIERAKERMKNGKAMITDVFKLQCAYSATPNFSKT